MGRVADWGWPRVAAGSRQHLERLVRDGRLPQAGLEAFKELVRQGKEARKNGPRSYRRVGRERLELAYVPFDLQEKFHASTARYRMLVAGVRGGKTAAGAAELVRLALTTPGTRWWVVAPTYKHVAVAELAIDEVLGHVRERVVVDRSIKRNEWTLFNGSILQARSGDRPDNLRGPKIHGIWIDEAAFLKEEALRVLRTRVSDTRGRIWGTTTPKGKNWVYEWWLRGRSDKHEGYEAFKWRSCDNPYFPPEEWEEVRQDVPADFFSQEYEAEFLDEAAGVFRNVDAVVLGLGDKMRGRKPHVLGADLAKQRDFSVFTVMGQNGQVVDWVRLNKTAWTEQLDILARMAKTWEAVVWIDTGGPGDVVYDFLEERLGEEWVEPVKMGGGDTKKRLIEALQVAIERRQITIPREERLLDELRWFEYKRLPSGRLRYEAPPGLHDDCVISLALANWGRYQGTAGAQPDVRGWDPKPFTELGRHFGEPGLTHGTLAMGGRLGKLFGGRN